MLEVQNAAREVLLNMALAVISLLAAYGMFYIQKAAARVRMQTSQLKDEASRQLLTNALADVERLAMLTVSAAEQTTAKALREAVKNGTGRREDLLVLGQKVFDEVKTAISPTAQKVITENIGNFDAYLTKCIEDAVRRVKQEDPFITLPGELLPTS